MRQSKYTAEQIEFIKENVENPNKYLTSIFNLRFGTNITECAMSCLKIKHGLRSNLKGSQRFTKDQLQFVKDNVVNPEKTLAKMFNERFGTNINDAAISNLKSRLHIKSGLVGGQFVKGQTPPNKGKKWADFMSEEGQQNSRKTCFKKGHISANNVPIGYERISKDGYIEVKIQDGCKNKNFKLKHRLVWEKNYGTIPKGCNIIFLDGNKLNVSIDNLALVSKNEMARLNQNHLIFNDKGLTKSGIAIVKLKNKIYEVVKNKEK